MWLDLTLVVNWFEIDDIAQRISVLLYLALLFGFSLNIAYAFETTYTAMISFFLAARIYFSLYLGWVAFQLPQIKVTMMMNAIIVSTSSALWISSIHLSYPSRLALVFPAIAIDHLGTLTVLYLMRQSQRPGHRFQKTLARYFDFYPAFNIEHRVERTNGFVTLVFGYSVLTILYQNRSHVGVNAFLGKGVLGLIQAFLFNWIYFEIDQYKIHVHAIRRHYVSTTLWLAGHQPFLMAYSLAAASLSRLVVAHDCADADPDTLGEAYVDRSVESIDAATRWFYCGGLALSLLSMCLISLTHIHKQIPHARLKKRPRLAIRACIAITILLLPLAHSLSSLSLISITTALVITVLIVDLYGLSRSGDRFWTGGFSKEMKHNAHYSANLRIKRKHRKQIEQAMRDGEKIGLETLTRLQRSDSSATSTTMLELKDEEWHGGHV
jgi:low temperature requirement protein LtrA